MIMGDWARHAAIAAEIPMIIWRETISAAPDCA
jgi:hypothetical protein